MSVRVYKKVLSPVPAPCNCGDNKWVSTEAGNLQCVNCAVVEPFPQKGMVVTHHVFHHTHKESDRFYNRYRLVFAYARQSA